MSLINDYTLPGYDGSAGARFRSTGREQQAGSARAERSSELVARRLARREQRRIAIAAPRPENRGMATPQHRVAH